MTLTLKAEKRDKKGKLDGLRGSGLFPAVYYGKNLEAVSVQMSERDFIKVWREAGESSVVSLETPEGKVDTLIHVVDEDPVTGRPIHADFYVFEKGKKVDVEVPLEFVGTSVAIKEKGCVLVKVLHEIKVEADPMNLPHEIEVDISSLADIDSHITTGDLKLPAGVTLSDEHDSEEIVVSASLPKEEKEDEGPVDLSAIEVEKKGKEDTDEEGGDSDTSK